MVYISGGTQLIDPIKALERLGVSEGMKIADLGCGGSGHFIIRAGQMVGEKGQVFAVDIVRSVLNEVAKKARLEGVKNLKTIWANLEIYRSTKLPDNSIDAALLKNVLFQSKEHPNIFQEAKRILKPEGKLLVIDWTQKSAPFGPPLIDRVSPKAVKSLAASLQMQTVDEFAAGKYHFALVFQK